MNETATIRRYLWTGLVATFCFGKAPPPKNHFEDPATCRQCHPIHHREWKGSMMHYSAESPVFQTFELTTRKLTGRFGVHDDQNPTFCINCHTPTAAYKNELIHLKKDEVSLKAMSDISREGLHCTLCHSVRTPDKAVKPDKGLLGDGIANASFYFFPFYQWVGPTTEEPLPKANDYHVEGFWPKKESSLYLKSPQFCGSCHNVHVPNSPDTVSGEPFQRIENLYTEWEKGPYNTSDNPYGKVTTCTDCHMSLYGAFDSSKRPYPPGSFPTIHVATESNVRRRHALHSFTAVSKSLLGETAKFPNQDVSGVDPLGFPIGQEQRRRQMLGRACELHLSSSRSFAGPLNFLPLEFTLTNKGAGHRVPSGFSQEREMWLEVQVTDSSGNTLYHSGYLKDQPHPEVGESHPDGRTHDESLNDLDLSLSTPTLEVSDWKMGADFNQRPFRNLGVPVFHNAFLRKKTSKSYERVHFFTLANHMDNTRSLPMLKPVKIRYDIPLQEWLKKCPKYCGALTVRSWLNYRTLPPKLMRALIQREPTLLSEANIDRNTIVTMASTVNQIQVCGLSSKLLAEPPLSVERQNHLFESGGMRWRAFPIPTDFEEAQSRCSSQQCTLPTAAEYDLLGMATYTRSPGDNHDELWTERWTRSENGSAATYLIGGGQERVGSPDSVNQLKLPHLCLCGKAGGLK